MSADAQTQQDAIVALRRGNTELIEALMDMVAQFFYEGRDGLFRHSSMSAEENAIKTLIAAGFAREISGEYELLWDKLPERWLEINGKLPPAVVPA
ncbi:MAG: hypothetical protein ACYDB0_07045 [Acidithiobacillus sp.]